MDVVRHTPEPPSNPFAHCNPGVTLVLPAFNEAESIEKAVREAIVALQSLTQDYEIIVVDDGSHDSTSAIVESIRDENSAVRIVKHSTNHGYGAAIRTGFEQASKEFVAFTDSDCQFDLGELDRFMLLARDYDVVCGYRIDRQDSPLRCFVSQVFNLMARQMLGIDVRDIDCAFKLLRKDAYQRLSISSDGFLVNTELLMLAKEKGLSVVEVGVSHRRRDLGQSTVSMWHICPVFVSLVRLWWNKSVFADAANVAVEYSEGSRWKSRLATIFVSVLTALLLYTNLSYPLIDRDETRYAEIPREMLVTGNWIMPQLNFQPYYDKPPLFYWLCASSYKLFGISEWSARIVPATAGLLMVMATFWFGRRTFGLRTAVLSSIALISSAGFLFCNRFLFIDAVLSLLVTLSMFFAYEAIRSGQLRWSWWMLSAVCCGLGVLAKGPVAGVLLGPPVFAFAWLSSSHARIQFRHWCAYGAIAFGVAAPWFIAVVFHDSSFAYEFFYNHNLQRFAGAYHQKPFWFYIPVAMAFGHPWTCLAIPYLVFLGSRNKLSRQLRPSAIGYLLLWMGWCILFFSLSRGKLPAYILPVAPAFALLVGYFVNQTIFGSSEESYFRYARWFLPWSASIVTCLTAFALGGVVIWLGAVEPARLAFTLIPWGVVLIALLVFNRHLRRPTVAWAACSCTALALVCQSAQDWVPSVGHEQATLSSTSPLTKTLRDNGRPVATYASEWAGVPFYLGRTNVRNFRGTQLRELIEFIDTHPHTTLFVRNSTDLTILEKALPPSATIEKIDVRGPAMIVSTRNVVGDRTAAKANAPLD